MNAAPQNLIKSPIEYLKGVGLKRGELLRNEAGIYTFGDLVEYFPFRYVDRSKFYKTSEITDDSAYVQLMGFISKIELHGQKRSTRMTAAFSDGHGTIELVWFNGFRWLKNAFNPKVEYIVFGKPNLFGRRISIVHPEIEPVLPGALNQESAMQPIYNSTEKLRSQGLSSKGISKLIRVLLPQVIDYIRETLPQSVLQSCNLPDRRTSLLHIHFPADSQALKNAITRLKFEELFFLQLNVLKVKHVRTEKSGGCIFGKIGDYFNGFYSNCLPFQLTEAQKRVLREIRRDTISGKQMNRLLQGDVGSGKTIVSVLTMLMALDNGYQACLMAPTEILALQHFELISRLFGPMDIKLGVLTSSTRSAERQRLLKDLKSGDLQIIIGTHALIEDPVEFCRLGMVIIDEQHRFGVAQRARLWTKSKTPPHVLVMTATPIPRTLAMTLYGDLDVSVIDELPPNRKPVKTIHQYDSNRLKVFGFMREQIHKGRQVYVVYPLIKESETLDLKDLTDGYESIVREFPLPQYAVSIVHGQMKASDKDFEMQRFVKGQTHIMVATTVIEVGIDVPNASVMVIESAERFGLSQLHQLRGRVGRGADQSYCILMSGIKLSTDSRKRLETMVKTNDGFEIAEVDLKLRGPGDIQGTQQSGMLELKLADLTNDEALLVLAREKASEILKSDPQLILPEHRVVAKHLSESLQAKQAWSRIS
ncbi:MAG TPA: ATP-dependent DNA helicase RecG [Bacteroidales bacterium]|nr:ATP-dependent DNA helicase RecG [Bacteroidales bacterium]